LIATARRLSTSSSTMKGSRRSNRRGGISRLAGHDLEAHHVWPSLIDMHAHLDKRHTVTRTQNRDGSFADHDNQRLRSVLGTGPPRMSNRRTEYDLRCAYVHVSRRSAHTSIHTSRTSAEELGSVPRDGAARGDAAFFMATPSLAPGWIMRLR
jgi:cytosine deaminase